MQAALKASIATPAKPLALPGFEAVSRYWDGQAGVYVAKILPGEYYVTRANELIATVLGSCVSACVRDPERGIGGMNHFMLPEAGDEGQGAANVAARYGGVAMEHMLNTIFKFGGERARLEVKIVGGGRIMAQASDVGARNIEFVRSYLATEGFRIAAADVGDIHPRKVLYSPTTGKMRVKKLQALHDESLARHELAYRESLRQRPVAGDIELF